MSTTMKSDLKLARSLFEKGKAQDALDLYQRLLDEYQSMDVDILRDRAWAQAQYGDKTEALNDREIIIGSDNAKVSDFYFAAELAIELGELGKAVVYLDEVTNRSLEQGDSYYLQESRLLKAFCSLKLGSVEEAMSLIQGVDDDIELLWVAGEERISKRDILDALEKT